jgi:hypothetical protein
METKRASQSLTVWSGLASSVGGMAVLISVILQQSGVETSTEEVGAILGGLVSMVTGALAIYGRWRASTRIGR